MKLVIFGLTISSSWANGHATLWRGLCRSLGKLGHRVVFYERDVPYYASARDFDQLEQGELVLYPDWESIRHRTKRDVAEADVAMVTSYCPDALTATNIVVESSRLSVFYDLDTPITLMRLRRGEAVEYVGSAGLSSFDLVLSYTGGPALDELRSRLGARRVAPLYGHVDPDVHRPADAVRHYRADLSYLGTYAADRQAALETLLIKPARLRPRQRFLMGGAQYPAEFPWSSNIYFVRHLPPSEHPAFFSSSRMTLNVTRREMAGMGWCPSGRLFEAAACGTPVLSDDWGGLDRFFSPGREILVAHGTGEAVAALDLSDAEIRRIGKAARDRALTDHTSRHRAAVLLDILSRASTDAGARKFEGVEA
ncbi:MAG TPA: glycosyltransferase [Bradyrhizobium sp.]|nr:glycosyltransferase [Bradyrhizobium sp.]